MIIITGMMLNSFDLLGNLSEIQSTSLKISKKKKRN